MGDQLLQAFIQVFDFDTILLIFIGSLFGIIAGAIPGFTIMMGIILIFPFTFSMDPVNGLATMIGVLIGGLSGGQFAGILIGIPGTPSSIATTFDGFPMAKQGEPGRALGIGVLASFFGTLISTIIIIAIGPLVAKFALKFGPWEVTAVILFALTLVASLSQGAMVKGLISGGLGLLIATFGIDQSGRPRFDFGIDALTAGFQSLPVMIGLFAFTQLIENVITLKEDRQLQLEMRKVNSKIKIPYKLISKDIWNHKWALIRSSVIGTFIGTLPATGAEVANFVAYDQERKLSKHPEKFGKGVPEGIIAPEAANNGCGGGAFIPTLTLGIPGDMTSALMLGVLILHGITPGPLLFQGQGALVNSIYLSLVLSAVVVLVTQILLTRVFTRIVLIPQAILIPLIFMLCVVGSFALNNSMFDVWTFFVFGLIGCVMAYLGIPLVPMILGLILGKSLETQIFRAFELESSWTTFFTRPISGVLFLITAISIVVSIRQSRQIERKLQESKSASQ